MTGYRRTLQIGLFLAGVSIGSVVAAQESDAQAAGDTKAQQDANVQNVTASPGAQPIVVTARRREESLQETPVAVTALTSADLLASGVTRAEDIAAYVPNLVFERDAASGAIGRVLLRGVGALNSGITNDSGVGIYLDGVVLARASGTLIDTLDVERVEVLRGPQGTLYGRNTIGGAVNFITVKPGPDFSGSVSLTGAVPDEVTARAVLNVPLVDGLLYSRFGAFINNSQGYTLNRFNNQHFDDSDRYGFRAAFRLTPSDNLTIDLAADYSEDDSQGVGAQCTDAGVAATPFLVPLLNLTTGADYLDLCRSTEFERKTDFAYDAPTSSYIEQYGVSLTTEWDVDKFAFFDNAAIKGIFGWRHHNPFRVADLDGTILPIIHATDVGVNEYDEYSAELQFNGTAMDDRLNLTAGAYGFWEDGTNTRFTLLTPSLQLLGVFNNALDEQTIENRAYAGYGQATLDVNEVISLTGGLRYTTERKTFFKHRRVIGSNDPSGPVLSTPTNTTLSETFDAWTFMGNASLKLPESMTVPGFLDEGLAYFTFSQGFKSGGFNGEGNADLGNLNKFDAEKLDSYELGLKLTMFDRRLILNTAVFQSNYNDIQVAVLASDPNTGLLIQQTQNAGRAIIRGVEFEAAAYPVPGLEIRGSLGLLDADYREYNSFFQGLPVDRSVEPMTRIPNYNASVSVQYRAEVGGGAITTRGEWTITGRRFFHSTPLPEAIIAFREPSYSLFNARIAFELPNEKTEIALFGRNLFDTEYRRDIIDISDALGSGLSYYGPPLTVGVQLNHRF